MVRIISTDLKNHLAQECTTLATCWKLTRRDGKEYYFTDLDANIVYDGNTYRADYGFDRTAIKAGVGLNVDNHDIKGFFDTAQIPEQEVRNGLFDSAEILIFVVNYEDLTQGHMILQKGHLGEVSISPSGEFNAEFRGLKQRLSQSVGEKYQPECRADLGDSRCKVPLNPDVISRSTAYALGDFVRVATDTTGFTNYALSITNAGFESTPSTGWTIYEGGVLNSATAHSGTWSLNGNGIDDTFRIYQDIDLTGVIGLSTTNLDAGYFRAASSVWRINSDTNDVDLGRFRVQALDSNGAVLGTLYDTGYEAGFAVWTERHKEGVLVPSGTRMVRIWCEGLTVEGSSPNARFDDVAVTLSDTGTAGGYQEVYENRIYECTTAGTTSGTAPTFDTTIDNTTTDGTAVFTARDAWTRHGEVATVTDNQIFTATITDSRAVDDWFNYGAVIWESGSNAGALMEIKDWVNSTGQLTLFLPMGYAISAGDKFRIFPGCQKRITDCAEKFVIDGSAYFDGGNAKNFRGEPYLPGRDFVGTYK